MSKGINRGFHSQMEGTSRKPHIEMPPLPEEKPVQVIQQEPAQQEPIQHFPDYQLPENEVVTEEIEQEVVDNSPVDEHLEQVEQEQEEQTPDPRDPRESFKQIRSAKEKAERERDALMSKMLELQSQQLAKANPKVEEPDELDLDVDPETLLEAKHMQKYIKQMKEMKKELRDYKSQSQEMVMERKLKSQYPDFDAVLNANSISALNDKHPSIAKALSNIPDDYEKAVAAYEMIKNLNINEDPMARKKSAINSAPVNSDKAKAVVNSNKPRPLASVSPQQGDSPLSKANAFANGMTDDLKEQLRKEMNQARRGF